MGIIGSQPPIKRVIMSLMAKMIIGGPKAWYSSGLWNYHSYYDGSIQLSQRWSGGSTKVGLGQFLGQKLEHVMLMVGPNQDTQQEAQRPIEVHPGAKLITRNCLGKQLVKNLPLDACGWAGQSRAHVQSIGFQYPLRNQE